MKGSLRESAEKCSPLFLVTTGETSISKGIVSAFRNDAGVNYIQTNAAVNPGCSGGPGAVFFVFNKDITAVFPNADLLLKFTDNFSSIDGMIIRVRLIGYD